VNRQEGATTARPLLPVSPCWTACQAATSCEPTGASRETLVLAAGDVRPVPEPSCGYVMEVKIQGLPDITEEAGEVRTALFRIEPVPLSTKEHS
jgi:hypothetical protein